VKVIIPCYKTSPGSLHGLRLIFSCSVFFLNRSLTEVSKSRSIHINETRVIRDHLVVVQLTLLPISPHLSSSAVRLCRSYTDFRRLLMMHLLD